MNSQKSVVGLWYASANLGCEGCFGAWDDRYQCRAGITRDASGVMLRFLGELVRHDIHSARLFLLVRIQVWKQKVLTGWPSHGTKSCSFLLWAVELQKSQSPRSMKLLDEYSEARNWAYAEVKWRGIRNGHHFSARRCIQAINLDALLKLGQSHGPQWPQNLQFFFFGTRFSHRLT